MGKNLIIKGDSIPYKVTNVAEYLLLHDGLSQKEIEKLLDNNYELYLKISQIIGLKQSLFLLWHTTKICQSTHDSLLELKINLIKELKEEYSYVFDEKWFEEMTKEGKQNV